MTPAEKQVETKIASLGLSAPRITPQHIDALVESLTFDTHYIPGTSSVVATSILPSGFTVATAISGAASHENNAIALCIETAIGKCRDESRRKLWELEGYRLKQTMHEIRQDVGRNAIAQARETLKASPAADAVDAPCCIGPACTSACGSSPRG